MGLKMDEEIVGYAARHIDQLEAMVERLQAQLEQAAVRIEELQVELAQEVARGLASYEAMECLASDGEAFAWGEGYRDAKEENKWE